MLGWDHFALSLLVSPCLHGMSGCWAEMIWLCFPLSPLVSHGMSGGKPVAVQPLKVMADLAGCWAQMICFVWPCLSWHVWMLG